MNMKKLFFISMTFIIFFGIITSKNAMSWNEKVTHKDLSRYASESSILRSCKDEQDQKCNYLKNLGFEKGVKQEIKWDETKTIKEWLALGGELEDSATKLELICGNARSYNHFHNPTKTWDNAGLDDYVLNLCPPLIPPVRHATGESSLLWMQDGSRQQNFREGDWTWQRIRDVYYWALTDTSETSRQVNFAQTFRGLGHQMHLIQDSGQPDHVRNDAHPEDAVLGKHPLNGSRYFETWAKEKFRNLNELKAFTLTLPSPVLFPEVALNISYDNLVPITQFIDTKQYYNVRTPSTSLSQGISEYTNANFFSDDTIFAAERYATDHRHYFPFPRRTGTDLQDIINGTKPSETTITDDGKSDTAVWISKTSDGELIEHFARTSYNSKDTYDQYGEGNLFYSTIYLDEKCHEDYAKLLLPRAVGYSAGLLDYFFRGTLEITPPDQVAYAVTDGSQTPYVDNNTGKLHQQFTTIKAKVRNATPDTLPGEEVQGCDLIQGNCTLQAVAKYKIIPNYDPYLENYPPNETNMQNTPFSYSVSAPIEIDSLSSETPQQFDFDFTNSPIPAGITDLYLQVVFKGTLGNETDIAVAVGMKDLMEPTHQVFWNLTDMFSLYIPEDTYHLYTAYDNPYTEVVDGIRNIPALADEVDLDRNGELNPPDTSDPYIDPLNLSFSIGYLSEPPHQGQIVYYSAISDLQPGRHIRLIALFDKEQGNYFVLKETDMIFGTAYFYDASVGVVNQEANGVLQTTPMTTFRYGLDIDGVTPIPIRQHFSYGLLNCYPKATNPATGEQFCPYAESKSIPAELTPILIPEGELMQSPAYSPSHSYSEGQTVPASNAPWSAIVK